MAKPVSSVKALVEDEVVVLWPKGFSGSSGQNSETVEVVITVLVVELISVVVTVELVVVVIVIVVVVDVVVARVVFDVIVDLLVVEKNVDFIEVVGNGALVVTAVLVLVLPVEVVDVVSTVCNVVDASCIVVVDSAGDKEESPVQTHSSPFVQ